MLNDAQRELVTKNHNLIYWYINLKGIAKDKEDDWYGLLAIELCKAVESYDSSRGSLSNYFKMKADNMMLNEYAKANRKKRSNNGVISLDEIEEIIPDLKYEFEDGFMIESSDGVIKEILQLRADGYTQSEIASLIGVTQSYISQLLSKFRKEYVDD